VSDEYRHESEHEEGPRITDRRKYAEEARRELTAEERAQYEENQRRIQERIAAAPQPEDNQSGYAIGVDPAQAEQDPNAPRKVMTAFFVIRTFDGNVGVEPDISVEYEAQRPAGFGDFLECSRAIYDEMKIQRTSAAVDQMMQQRAQAMAQQMHAQQLAQEAGMGGPQMPGGPNRQQRRHPGR
jgi:hypothetical protein